MTIVRYGTAEEILLRHPSAEHMLTTVERDRAAAFRFPDDARTFVAAHVLVRECAALALGTTVDRITLAQSCPTCMRTDHGRPSVEEEPGLWVSLSHSRGHVAACAGEGPLGIDIEVASRSVDPMLADSVLAPAEAAQVQRASDPGLAFLRFWVRKEALIKAGRLTLDRLAEADLSADDTAWDGMYLSGWGQPDGVVGALATPSPYLPA